MSNDLTFFERQKFQYYASRKISLRNIGRIMRRDHSILSRELKKCSLARERYRADIAQQAYEKRKHRKRRGKMDRHPKLKEYGIETYFCDTYAAWQKGGVENMNKQIRRYLPKKTDMSELSQADIYDIQEKLNNRPRKCLNYQTPNEVFKKVVL